MKKFLAIYLVSEASMVDWKKLGEKEKKEIEKMGMEKWMKWSKKNAKWITDHGAPLGKTMRINTLGVSNTKNNLGAYTIVQAKSLDEAAKLFESHPHFTMFPGESVEVIECLPMPEMPKM